MARNEEGEFELMLGNKQLLSVFFLMVLLLVLCFVGGYALGRNAAPPVLTATSESPVQETKPLVVESVAPKAEPTPAKAPPPAPEPTPVATRTPEPPPAKSVPAPPKSTAPMKTAPQVAEPVQAKATPPPAKAPPIKDVPPPPPPTKQVAGAQPIPGRIYLQLSATDKDKAEVMADLLRRKNLPGFAAPIADRPGMYRVLVGPLAATALPAMKAQLKSNGFPGDEAIRRVF